MFIALATLETDFSSE